MVTRHNKATNTDIASFENCEYKKGYCYSLDGTHLIWDRAEKVDSEYVEVGTYNATILNNNVLINNLAMNFLLNDRTPAPDLIIKDREYRLTLVHELLQPKVGSSLDVTSEEIEALQHQIDSKFSFLVNMISSPRAQLTYLCGVLNMIIDLEHLSATVDPTAYIRRKSNNDYLTATKAGDYLVVFPCLKVESWSWITRNIENDTCYAGIPVKYSLTGSENSYEGYLQPIDNTILANGIPVPCHKMQNTYTYVDKTLELHSGNAKNITRVDTENAIPLEIETGNSPEFVDFVNRAWAYGSEELSHTQIERQILDQITSELFDMNEVAKVDNIHYVWRLLHITEGTSVAVILALITWLERILVVILTYKCIVKPYMSRLVTYRRTRRYHDSVELSDMSSQD